MSNSQSVSVLCLRNCSEDIEKAFWQLWQQNRDYLYRCCFKWMGGNPISYQDIAQQLALSLDNVYKRIQQARDFLQKRLSKYFLGLDDALLDSSESCTRGKSVVERFQSDETTIPDFLAVKTTGCMDETINYQLTASCLETLNYGWYRSLGSLGWS
ncbi:MAG TPA: hypothetical protein DCP31_06385 [Cyanobacteria bacterium UBA8543]|nr:hypothetical protein [Cyanobacteria bacterium UBA8543]